MTHDACALLATACASLAVANPGAPMVRPARGHRQEVHCREAHRFLVETVGMAARTEPDTIDDWRTHRTVVGCRVTAAGVTTRAPKAEVERFFEALRDAGWTRTPDPRDAPNEASLRFRRDGSDCLFNFYTGGLLGTEAEFAVDEERVPDAGESRYNVLALCMPAMEAAGDAAYASASSPSR